MDFWLLRHSDPENRAKSGKDRDRALTPDGLRRAREAGRGLALLEPDLAAIWTSPYLRARQTAEAAARALGFRRRLHPTDALAPECDPEQVLEELEASGASGAVLLVGHQPHLGALLGFLVAGNGVEIPLEKLSLARVERLTRRSGALRAFLPAALLERLAARGPERTPLL
jgi:phosphohistidine phosphatase